MNAENAQSEKQSIVTSYLEMLVPPDTVQGEERKEARVVRDGQLSYELYMYLQNTIGAPYNWVERQAMTQEQVMAQINHPEVDVLLFYVDEELAGFGELDRRSSDSLELKFFGLLPQFIGKGLGQYFLDRVVRYAWSYRPQRVWLHTDTDDHPRAITVYQNAGFRIYKQEAG